MEGESEVFAFLFCRRVAFILREGKKYHQAQREEGRGKERWGGGGDDAGSGEIKIGGQFPDPILSVHFLEFHSAILKPDFDLSVCKVNGLANLQAALSRQIHIEQKFFLQFQRLVFSIGAPLLPSALCCQPISCGVFCLYLLC